MNAICSSHGDAPDSDGVSSAGPQLCEGGNEESLGTSLVPAERGWNLDGCDSRNPGAEFRGLQAGRRPRPPNDQQMTARLRSRKLNRRFRLLIDPVEASGGGSQ